MTKRRVFVKPVDALKFPQPMLEKLMKCEERSRWACHALFRMADTDGLFPFQPEKLKSVVCPWGSMEEFVAVFSDLESASVIEKIYDDRGAEFYVFKDWNGALNGREDSSSSRIATDHHDFIEWWMKNYPFGAYHFVGGKDGAAVNRLLKTHSLEELKELCKIGWTTKDQFLFKMCSDLAGFSMVINRLKPFLAKGPFQKYGTGET
jgi:hypothetical protein